MSVASEFAPEVHIPERARRTMAGGQSRARHLSLVVTPEARPVIEPSRGPDALCLEELGYQSIPVAARTAGALRLTARGKVAIAAVTGLCALLLVVVAHASAGSAVRSAPMPVGATVTVQPGDTLWMIAQRYEPGRDPRRVVDRLRAVNHLDSVALTPGQTLKLG